MIIYILYFNVSTYFLQYRQVKSKLERNPSIPGRTGSKHMGLWPKTRFCSAAGEILHEARDPALLEQSAGNIFTARVFPIEPHATCHVGVHDTKMVLGVSKEAIICCMVLPPKNNNTWCHFADPRRTSWENAWCKTARSPCFFFFFFFFRVT